METAAVFVNTLIEARDSRPKGLNGLSTDDIEAISREMETIRKGSAKSVVTTSQGFQSILTKDRPMLSNLILKVVMPLLGGEATTTTVGEASTGVQRVKKLPVPRRPRVNPYRFELPTTPLSSGLDSKIRLVFFYVMGFALMAGPPGKSSVPTTNMELINKLSQLMSPLLIYTVEGYRVGHRRNILALPILFTVGTQVFGAGRVIPVYATLHTLFRFNNPASRFVGTEVVYALGLAFILACGVPAFLFLTSEATDTTVLENETLWQYLPVLFSACTLGSSSVISWFKKGKTNRVEKPGDKRGQARERKAPVERDEASFERYYDADVPILKSVYMGVFAFQASVHFGQLLTLVFDHRMPLHSSLVWSPAHAALCSHNIYCIWDLRRRGYVTTGRAVKAALGIVAGQVIYGSGATWTGLWVWREGAISGLSTMH